MNLVRAEDFRLALRRLRKDVGVTMASVAAMACAIGAAVATWSLLSAVLLKPLPVAEPDRLFQVETLSSFQPDRVAVHPYPLFEAIRDSSTFDRIAAGGALNMLVIEQGEVPRRRRVFFADHDFFATLGITTARGRTFTEDEDRRGARPVAVLSDHYWRRVLNADPAVLGRTVTVSGTAATIVGILPRGFRGLDLSEAPDLYLPLRVAGDIDHELFNIIPPLGWQFRLIRIVGRLRHGETPSAVAARLNAVRPDCPTCADRAIGPFLLTNVEIAAVPEAVRARTVQFTTLLSITVGLLLLIGCLTVGMLLLVRTEDRRDELALCLALGATPGRLMCGIAFEAAMLCTLGAVLAIPVAVWLYYGVRAFQLPGGIDIELLELTLDPAAWLAVTCAALGATTLIALLASLFGIGAAARAPLQSRTLATPRVTRRAPRTALVAGQVAITLVLVTGAGLFTRSLIEALSLNPEVDTGRIVRADLTLGPFGYSPERAAAFIEDLRERLRQNGAIAAVSIARVEGSSMAGYEATIDGIPREMPSALTRWQVDEYFFSTIGLPIVGRGFALSDTNGAPLVAVVSESLGRLIAAGGNPVGHHITEPLTPGGPAVAEIIGVVPDLILNVNETDPSAIYYSRAQRSLFPPDSTRFFFRSAGDPRAATREAATTLRAMDPRLTLEQMMTLDEQIGRQMNPQRFGIYVLGALGGIALLLTVLGTYVIAESMVVRRRREMGIRAALGAGSAQLRGLVLRDTARLVGLGLIAGFVLAVLGSRLIRSLLYQVEPLDPLVLTIVSAVIFGLALLVSLRPALEATRLDLTRSLREE